MAVFENRWRAIDPYHTLTKFPAEGGPGRLLDGYDENKRRWDDYDPVPESVRQMQAVLQALGLHIRALPDGGAEAIEIATGRVKYAWRHVTELIEQLRDNEMETSNGKHESGVPGVIWQRGAWQVQPYHPEVKKAIYFMRFTLEELDLAKQAVDEVPRTPLSQIPTLRERYKTLRGSERPPRAVNKSETRLVHVPTSLPMPTADIHTLLDRALAANAAYHQADATLRRAKADFATAWGEYLAALAKLGVVAAAFDEIEMDG